MSRLADLIVAAVQLEQAARAAGAQAIVYVHGCSRELIEGASELGERKSCSNATEEWDAVRLGPGAILFSEHRPARPTVDEIDRPTIRLAGPDRDHEALPDDGRATTEWTSVLTRLPTSKDGVG